MAKKTHDKKKTGTILEKAVLPDRVEQVVPLAKGLSKQYLRVSSHLALTSTAETINEINEMCEDWSECEPCLKIASIAASKDLKKINEECGNSPGSPALKHVVGGLLASEWIAKMSSEKTADFQSWEADDHTELKQILSHYLKLNSAGMVIIIFFFFFFFFEII